MPIWHAILQKEIKSRREAIQDGEKADRPDLVEAANADITVIEKFLPKAMEPAELERITREVIAEVGATGMTDMGKVMKVLLPKLEGRAPNDQVSQLVRQLITTASLMQASYIERYQKNNRFRVFARFIILIVAGILSWVALALPIELRPSEYTLNIGDVTNQDILAPRSLTFTSDILTQKARQEAESRVSPVYLPVDLEISKTQLGAVTNESCAY